MAQLTYCEGSIARYFQEDFILFFNVYYVLYDTWICAYLTYYQRTYFLGKNDKCLTQEKVGKGLLLLSLRHYGHHLL